MNINMLPDYEVSTFYGLNTSIKDIKSLKPGFSPDALNWITGRDKDHIELRRGRARLGETDHGAGKVTGMGVGVTYDATHVLMYSFDRKINYYDAGTDDTSEISTSNILPEGADGEDVWFRPYQSLAGSMIYIGSENSGVYKSPTANPDSAVDQQVNNHRFGVFHIGQNRVFASQRNGIVAGNRDETGAYLSYIDKDQLSDYTQVTGEAYGTGDGIETTFAHSLTDISAPKTAMYVTVTDTVETFIDDRNGNMVGDLGGTGTVNYATGAVSVTFATAPAGAQAITCGYYHETSSSTGILDFTGGGNGQGKTFRQDSGGGKTMAIFNLGTIEFWFHQLKTWQFTATLDDTESTNLPYRDVGIAYPRAAFLGPDGIIFADTARPNEPKFRILKTVRGSSNTRIEPFSISDALDLAPFAFDYCVAFRWGDYNIFCVQEKISGTANEYNSVMWVQNTLSKAWDKLDYNATCLVDFNGTLVAGDPLSKNVYTLFSGYDEDGDIIRNYYTTTDLNLNTEHLKVCHFLEMKGLIQKDQSYKLQVSYDGGPFTDVFTVEGSASYVDTGVSTYIGGPTVGSQVVGGGGSDSAHPYEVQIPLHSDKFKDIRLRFEALGIGYVSIDSYKFKDLRDKGRKNLPTRTV